MSESFPHRVERLDHQPTLPSPERHRALPERGEIAKAEKQQETALVEARQQVAETSVENRPAAAAERFSGSEEPSAPPARQHINRELRDITLNRELRHLQRKLTPTQRTFSKMIHQPAVRVTSEVIGNTVSRPSGLLGGGILALFGTSVYLYMAKYIGMSYNYSVFLVLFAGGFALGLALELFVHLFVARRASD